ncbi:MAG: putative ABC transport system permease protein [Saprospiraceae bacterium]|jgi:putative ABC transport system permease protein
MQRVIFNFILAMEGVFSNKLRAFLTALGIIFGVGAVIAMLAIGNGAKQAILEQMKLIGTNNIVIQSKVLTEDDLASGADQNNNTNQKDLRPWSPGLTMEDAIAIERLIPSIEKLSPEIVLSTNIIQSAKLEKAKCIGVTNSFFELNNLELSKGKYFHYKHMEAGKAVCIIGKNVQTKFFPQDDPIGLKIKCGNVWLTIIGVLKKRIASSESLENLGIRDYNSDVYIPVSTALIRFKNRALVSKEDIKRGRGDDDDVDKTENYHQLDKLVLRVDKSENMKATAQVVARVLKRRHQGLIDYEVNVPELELQQEQATKDRLNLVLAFIAGISLLVGGIGIMNIMLATVLERIKEIGVRRSLGALQTDITLQFLFEAIFISLIGGLIGVILGVSTAYIIEKYFEIPAEVSTWSVVVSFFVAASVGLIFGLFPAEKAARMDPIKALRTE